MTLSQSLNWLHVRYHEMTSQSNASDAPLIDMDAARPSAVRRRTTHSGFTQARITRKTKKARGIGPLKCSVSRPRGHGCKLPALRLE